jgi:uncharacterized membrane protein
VREEKRLNLQRVGGDDCHVREITCTMSEPNKTDRRAITPRWGKYTMIALAIGLAAFALDRYLSGLAAHKYLLTFIAPEFAQIQLDKIAERPILEALHRLGGTVLLVAGLMQFSTRLRRERPKLHRLTGYTYILLAISAGISGLYFGLLDPFGGVNEAIPAAVFGLALIVETAVALSYARRRSFEIHREWMVRSYALVLGPMMIRIIYIPTWALFGVPERESIVISFWAGWLLNVAVAEWWIAARRRRLQPAG